MKKVFVFLKKDWTYKNLHIQKILKKFCAKFFFGFSLSFLFLVVVFRGEGGSSRKTLLFSKHKNSVTTRRLFVLFF